MIVLIALESPVRVYLGARGWQRVRSVVVPSEHPYAIDACGSPVAIFYVAVDLFARVTDVKILLTGLGIGTTGFATLNLGALAIAVAQHAVKLGAPPSAIYTSSNEVAMFLEPPFAMATALLLYGESGRQRRWVLVWWLFVTASLLLTFSRGALGALAVYMLFTIVSAKPELRRPLIVVGIAVVVVAAIGLVVAANTPLVETRFSFIGLHFAWNGRSNIYVHTIETIVQHPIFGVGLGNFVFISHRRPLIYPHDLYLSLWVEIGLLGLVAFLWIMLRLLFETYKDRVYQIALYFFGGDEAQAADITQQVFLKLFTKIAQFRSEAEFTTWLYRLTTNACVDEQRKQRRLSQFDETFTPDEARVAAAQEAGYARRELAAVGINVGSTRMSTMVVITTRSDRVER